MSIFFKKLWTANWPITWRKQTQPYNNAFYSVVKRIEKLSTYAKKGVTKIDSSVYVTQVSFLQITICINKLILPQNFNIFNLLTQEADKQWIINSIHWRNQSLIWKLAIQRNQLPVFNRARSTTHASSPTWYTAEFLNQFAESLPLSFPSKTSAKLPKQPKKTPRKWQWTT